MHLKTGEDKADNIVILSIILSVFIFLIFCGTINSGFHFVDDHEVIRMKSDLKSASFPEVTKKWVLEDIRSNTRFRPLYYWHRVLQVWVFGSNFLLLSIYNGVLCCLALGFCFSGMRKLSFSLGESIVFLIITFIGPQSSVWWRLGPGESLGMVFLSLAFYFMTKSLTGKNYLANNVLFIFFLILASLTKESFMITIPGMIFFKIWNEKNNIWPSLKESLIRNSVLAVPLIVVGIELYIIKKYVGTGYAGLDSNLLSNIKSALLNSLHFLKAYLNLLIVLLLLIALNWRFKRRFLKFDFLPVVFFILIFVPNLILYTSSGLVERYLLPVTFGLGFLIASFIKRIENDPVWLKKTAIALVIAGFIPFFISSVGKAIKFADEGRKTNKLLSSIEANYVNGNQVIAIVDPVESYEYSVSLKTYLLYENKIDLYGYSLTKNDSSNNADYIEGWKSYFEGRQYENMTSRPQLLIFLDNKLIDKFFDSGKLVRDDYVTLDIGAAPFALLKCKL